MEGFGKFLKMERIKAGVDSQKALALKMGIATNYVSMWERGERIPSRDQCYRIASALKINRETVEIAAGYEAHCFVCGGNHAPPENAKKLIHTNIIQIPLFKNGHIINGYIRSHNAGGMEMVECPKNWNADLAVVAEGHTMESFGIVPGAILFIEKTQESQPEELCLFHVFEGEKEKAIVKKCKESEGRKIFLNSRGEITLPHNARHIGRVVRIVINTLKMATAAIIPLNFM